MTMGLSNVSNEQPTFVFNPTGYTYPPGTQLDENGKPYDLSVMATPTVLASIQVPCAIEWGSGKTVDYRIEPVGDFQDGDMVLTLLDTDYNQVKAADYVMMGNQKYEIRFLEPQFGLFDVSVYRIHCRAIQEHA
jgi:hypothetical protein